MGRRGPRPAPAMVKLARGTHKASRDGRPEDAIGEVIPLPEAPDWLGEPGRKAWERYGRIAESCGQLEERYLPALERLCDAHDRLADARQDIYEMGRTAETEKGYEHARPAVAIEREAREEIRRYLIEFGWTPAAASSVKVKTSSGVASVKRRERA